MADLIEEDKKNVAPSEAKKDAKATPKTPTNKPTGSVGKNIAISAAILLSLSALGLSGWQFYQSYLYQYSSKLTELENSQKVLDSRLVTQKNAFADIEPVLTKITPTLNKLEQANQYTQESNSRISSDIDILQQKLKRMESTTKEDWKLAEAEYLIRLANQRLLMEKDIIGATNMLTNADDILVQLADPLLFSTRRTLAKDIQNLKSTPSFDLEGIYLQLEALSTQTLDLPQKGHAQTIAEPTLSEEKTVSKGLMAELWDTLKSLIIINYNSKPIKQLLPPTEYNQLIVNIQLQINVAQLALLKQESSIYQTALEHVSKTVNANFDLNSLAISSFLTSLTALQQINPSPELPLPRDSLIAIKEASQAWHGMINANKEQAETAK